MIESCPKRRMVIGISLLAILTILVLIIESQWTEAPRQKQFILENNSTCWLKEEFVILQDCQPCTAFEIKSKVQGVCVHTHNKERLKCKSGEIVSRSCDKVAWLDEKNFWTFEGVLFMTGAIFTLFSFQRQRVLDRKIQQRIQRQLNQAV